MFVASKVCAIITSAHVSPRTTISDVLSRSNVTSGIESLGNPASTCGRCFTPNLSICKNAVAIAPSTISTTDIGNFGIYFLQTRIITTVPNPRTADNTLKYFNWSVICRMSSISSPVPAAPPNSLGTCISIIVIPIPLMKPPMTGVDM